MGMVQSGMYHRSAYKMQEGGVVNVHVGRLALEREKKSLQRKSSIGRKSLGMRAMQVRWRREMEYVECEAGAAHG